MILEIKNKKVVGESCNNVSVIVAAKNEEKYIEKCIDSLLAQEFFGTFEIIVIDNCSEDNTRALAENKGIFVAGFEGRSPAAVRNFGASLAKYSIYAFIDGDCEAPINWLARAIVNLKENNVGMAGGGCLSPLLSNMIVKSWAPPSVIENPKKIYNIVISGSNMIIKKKIFESIGGFNDSLISAEDDDLCKRLMVAGFEIIKDDNMKVIHYGYPSTFKDVFLKSIWHGSTQLKAHGFFGDKMVLLTFMWVLFLGAFSTLLVVSSSLSSFFFYGLLLLPLLLCAARLRKFSFKDRIIYLPTLYLISNFVLFGRSVGMFKELFLRLFRGTFFQHNK